MEELAARQLSLGGQIQQIISNFKKDSASRKTTTAYYEERLQRIEDISSKFEETDNQIRLLVDVPMDHAYFVKDYYKEITALASQYSSHFKEMIMTLQDVLPPKDLPIQTHSDPPPSDSKTSKNNKDVTKMYDTTPESNVQETTSLNKLIRRQRALLGSLTRLLDALKPKEKEGQTLPHTHQMDELWAEIEKLHYNIWESCDDPISIGYNFNEYISCEKKVNDIRLSSSSIRSSSTTQENATNNLEAIKLPQITIPKFDGNYLAWRQFFDLFSQLVHTQPLPKVQKMWYLKTNLIGEAGNLVRALAVTEDNYDTAWNMLQDRYNDIRVLSSTTIQRLLGQSYNSSSASSIRAFHDTIRECLMSLNNLGITTSSWDPILLYLLLKKLDRPSHILYEQSLKNPKKLPTISEFLSFLEFQFHSLEATSDKNKLGRSCTSAITTHENSAKCIACKDRIHPLHTCNTFLKLTPADRLEFVKRYRLCFNCLKSYHSANMCQSRHCLKCNKRHNTLLHIDDDVYEQTYSATGSSNHEVISNTPVSLSASETFNKNSYVLLSTARIRIIANNGRKIECRAILDSGSQVNLVTDRLVKQLGIQPKHSGISIEGIGSKQKSCRYRVNVKIQSKLNGFSSRLEAFVLPKIVNDQPSLPLNISSWSIPLNIPLADPNFNQPGQIDALLGAEFFHQIFSIGQISLSNNLPSLQNTVFGWIVSGKVKKIDTKSATCGIFCDDDDTNTLLERFWKLDEVGDNRPNYTTAENLCELHFTQNTNRDNKGRFMVRLPFTENPGILGDSRHVALNRFLSLERRLDKNPQLKKSYVDFMEEYEKLGHMTEISSKAIPKDHYVIPHHCVFKNEKIRVVFDASATTSSGQSLNDIMHTGPTIQNDLFTILLRFRLPRYVFTTDIQKMYRQILMHPDDRKYQIIIWRQDPTKELKYYQLNTVTYGTRSAPYLATKCLLRLANETSTSHPMGSEALIKNFYVDDGLLGSNSLNSAIMLQKELTAILKSAGLELRKWCANHPQLLQEIPVEHQEINLDFDDDSLDRVKTLGLAWLPKEDTFCIKTPTACNSRKRVTKRSVSSDLARIFDPLGIMAPVVTVAKIFMQELWNLKISWDEALPAELHTKWTTFCDQLQELHDWKIPRHVHNHEIPQSTQLHVFVDASEKAYGAVIYLRSVTKDKRVIVRLLCGKSRVSPINRQHQTIARLELCSALLGTQLASRVQKDLNFEGSSIYFGTDSEVVLAWINSTSSSYEVFVANRIAKIQNLSLAQQWRHVGSKSNPADILSRGCDPKNFVRCNMWFFGPLFLHGNDTIWSKTALNENHFTTEEGVKRTKTALITLKGEMENIIDSINHGNSFKKLRRILAYVLRFKNLLRNKQEQRPRTWTLTPLELDASEKLIIRAIQTTEFKDEIGSLKRNNTVKSDSTIYSLHPFLDENGIIRVGGRLNASSLPYENKHQMFLPYNDPLTKLIMQMIHEDNMHCGPTALVSHVRQRFWPIKASIMARSIVHHCVRCFKARPRLLQQVMGDLPSARVTPSRPFINAGVDYCGPFWIHYKVRGKRPTKAYLAIFCCFSTKALHLELVTDLTTGAFIGALKRFTSRRGRCQNIYCDNATNFVGAKNHLQELSTAIHSADAQETIVNMCNDKGIHFHFIPPRAPHFGGLWEAAVKSAKHLLLRSVTTYSLTYEELETVITEVEAILNSRPLSPMSNDPNDLTALTPGHFLIGEPLITPIDANAVERKVSLGARWETVSKIKHEFWRRWSREYLNELQYRHKWQEQVANIEPGAVVILKEDNLPVLKWPLGRIIKVYKGEDNVVRVVDVKTAKGIFQRVINRVAPLPLADNKTTYASDEPRPTETTTVTNEHSVIPHKRRKTSSLTSKTTALLLVMFIMPLVWASGVTNTEFASEIGIHFEGVGQVKISQNNWQLIVYYELKTYWDEVQSFSKGTRALEHLCQEMKQGSTCKGVLSAIRQIEKEFQIDNSLLSTKRIKRGALNIVGNLANSLFGVLDSEYAQQMSNTIEAVKENEHHLNKLLQNQTSILDTTINILKQDQETIKKKFDDLDLQTTEILARLHDMEDTEYQSRVFNIFISLAMQLTITAANLQRIKSSILDVLTDTHHGKISPILLSPTQLQEELMKIRNYLPSSLQIPVDHDNHLQLYKLMRVEGGLTKNHVIFKISIPLSDQQPYELYKLYPIPSVVNDSLVAIQLCNEILAINPHRDQYFPMSSIMLHSCILTKPDTYLCSNIQSRYNKGSDVCSCEIHLLNNDTNLNCNIERMKTNAMWIQLSNNNQWIYSVKFPKRINTVCARQSQQLTLTGSGLITLQPQCTIKDNSITIQGHQSYTSARYESYTSLGNFKDIVKPQHLTTILQEVNPYRGQLDNLTELQESLARQQTLDLPRQIQNINYHYSIVGYTALSLTIILIMYNLYKIKTNQYRLQSTASQDPTPVPRQRSTSEFVVSTT